MPKVTIGMPVYNGATTIRRALDGLLAQSFDDFELIISDNASTDATAEICQEYAARDSRVRYVRQSENIGASMNFRFVLFEADTPYFMWVAADDLWAPSFLARHFAVLEADPGIVLSQSRVLFTMNGHPIYISDGTFALPHDETGNVVAYLTDPSDNSRYYGLFRTAVLQAVFPDRSFFALDWAVAAATLHFGRHHEIDDILMIRDITDVANYERAVARDHWFWLCRVFPVLYMTFWLLRKRQVPISARVLYSLAKLNLYMHFRFGLHRWHRAAEFYVTNNIGRRYQTLLLRHWVRYRIKRGLRRVLRAPLSVIYRAWRAMPLTLAQRQAVKRAMLQLVHLGRTVVRPVPAQIPEQGRTAASRAANALAMPALPSSGWRMLRPMGEYVPHLSIIVVTAGKVLNTLALIDSLAGAQHTAGDDVRIEFMLIDNGSADITGELFQALQGIRYQRSDPSAPFCVAANAAWPAALSDTLVFIEPTLRVDPDFLRQFLPGISARTLLGPQLRNWDGFLDAAGGIASVTIGLRGYGAGHSGAEAPFLYARTVDYCPGAFGLHRDTLARLGGFTPDYATFEISALDVATRLKASGGEAVYWPAAIASDWSGATRLADARIPVDDQVMAADWRRFVERNHDRLHFDDRGDNQLGDRSRRQRLLFVDAVTPEPDLNAGSILALNLMRMLGDLGFRVTFVPELNMTFAGHYTHALQALGIDAVYSPLCYSLDELLQKRGHEFDVVVLCRANIAGRYIEKTRELAPKARIVFNTIDLHFMREMREAQLRDDPQMLAAARRTEAVELTVVANTDATIVVSTHEEAILRAAVPGARVHVVPLLFDMPERLESTGPDNRYDIMFVGTYQHPPNADAAIYFAREIWPLVRSRLPEARFLVVGSSMTPEVQALAGNGVEVLGFVEDLNATLATCRLTVAPLRFGAGLKGKVASSQLAGVPVVATPIAVEGTSMRHGVEVMIADDPGSFADAVVKVYRDPVLWQQLAAEGFNFVRREYAIDANMDRVRAVLEDAGVTLPTLSRTVPANEEALAAATETPSSASCAGAARASPLDPPGHRVAGAIDWPVPEEAAGSGTAMRLSRASN